MLESGSTVVVVVADGSAEVEPTEVLLVGEPVLPLPEALSAKPVTPGWF